MLKTTMGTTLRRVALAAILVSSSLLLAELAHAAQPLRDGSHDFDWEVGRWHTHLKILRQYPDGSTSWVTYEGISDVIPIWNCRADIVELNATGRNGRRIEAINLRLYDPQSHQWSLNFANAKSGDMGVPTIGEFHHGIGTFYDQEAIGGREVLVRNIWSDIRYGSAHFVQSISDDGGKTWHPNWIAEDTRVKGTTDVCEKGGDTTSILKRRRPASVERPASITGVSQSGEDTRV
jgi:hypothetical protein